MEANTTGKPTCESVADLAACRVPAGRGLALRSPHFCDSRGPRNFRDLEHCDPPEIEPLLRKPVGEGRSADTNLGHSVTKSAQKWFQSIA